MLVFALIISGAVGLAIGRRVRGTAANNAPSVVFRQPSLGQSGGGLTDKEQAIATKVDQGLVDINTTLAYQRAAAAGTGMILTSNGEVLTNNHVIDGSTKITATVVSTGKTYTAKVVGEDPTADVAVIQLQNASGLTPIKTSSSPVNVGDAVLAIGNAGGQGGTPSVVTGTIQALGQSITASDEDGSGAEQLQDMIETNAPIQPGDSGGPLVNTAGEVVGMDTAAADTNRFNNFDSIGFAIPISKALDVAQQIEAGKASSTIHIGTPGFLGVAVQDTQGGAGVQGVVPDSPAANAGLQQGDVITSVNGNRINSAQDLTTQLSSKHPGDKVTIGWQDQNGQSHNTTVTLMAGPAD